MCVCLSFSIFSHFTVFWYSRDPRRQTARRKNNATATAEYVEWSHCCDCIKILLRLLLLHLFFRNIEEREKRPTVEAMYLSARRHCEIIPLKNHFRFKWPEAETFDRMPQFNCGCFRSTYHINITC